MADPARARASQQRRQARRATAAAIGLALLLLILLAPNSAAAASGLAIRIGLHWDRWAVECAGTVRQGIAAAAADAPLWPMPSAVSASGTAGVDVVVAAEPASYRMGVASKAAALWATEGRYLGAAALRTTGMPDALRTAGGSGQSTSGGYAVLRRQGSLWYCLLAAGAHGGLAADPQAEAHVASLRAAGWPARTLLWLDPAAAGQAGGAHVAVPMTGPLAGTSFELRLPAVFGAFPGGSPAGHAGRTYRGDLRVAAAGDRGLLAVVNLLDIEEYLLGVVPSEMPAGWPLEALKAQAVAARTYAVANLGKHSSRGFDLCDDVHCQAYLGFGNEYPGPTAAVRATAGVVATYGGRLINAVYHSHSGGATDSSAVIWGAATPYLAGTSTTYEQPYYWTATNTRAEVEGVVAAALGEDVPTGLFPLLELQPASFTPGGRATRVNLFGPQTKEQITASKLRSALGTYRLREAKFNAWGVWVASWWAGSTDAAAFEAALPVVTWAPGARGEGVMVQYQAPGGEQAGLALLDPAFFVFSGEGFGHGVGMSQWGAREMAALGRGYRDILANFYRGISLAANYGR